MYIQHHLAWWMTWNGGVYEDKSDELLMKLPGTGVRTRIGGVERSLWACLLAASVAALRRAAGCNGSEPGAYVRDNRGSDEALYRYMVKADASTGLGWPTFVVFFWAVALGVYSLLSVNCLAGLHCATAATVLALASCALFALNEEQEAVKLLSEAAAADSDSLFLAVGDGRVVLHYKKWLSEPRRCVRPRRVVSMVHGFGANTYSYECDPALFSGLGRAMGADCVTVHDTPGFGLTSRGDRLGDYSMLADCRALGELVAHVSAAPAGGSADASASSRQQRVVVAHSIGALACVLMLSLGFGRADAVVLVAPALWADDWEPAPQFVASPFRLLGALANATLETFMYIIAFLLQPLLRLLLHQLVRREGFWRALLKTMVFHESPWMVDQNRVDGYLRPRAVRGWDDGMVRVMRGVVSWRGPGAAFAQNVADARRSVSVISVACALRVLVQGGLPVLVVHGSEDRVVPCSNSRALKAMIPGLEYVEVAGVGHCVHEERPAEFSGIAAAFVRRALALGHGVPPRD